MKMHVKEIEEVTAADVMSAYSGRHGCRCGCRGKYSYTEIHRELGSERRGYSVTDDEIKPGQVTRILNVLKANATEVDIQLSFNSGEAIYNLRLGGRDYTLYVASTQA